MKGVYKYKMIYDKEVVLWMKHNVERLSYMVEHPYPNIGEQLWKLLMMVS